MYPQGNKITNIKVTNAKCDSVPLHVNIVTDGGLIYFPAGNVPSELL